MPRLEAERESFLKDDIYIYIYIYVYIYIYIYISPGLTRYISQTTLALLLLLTVLFLLVLTQIRSGA